MRLIDISGSRSGRLVVLEIARRARAKVFWRCRCDCGAYTEVSSGHLRNGRTRSCGCLRLEVRGKARLSHGRADSREYRAWENMRARCTNPKVDAYKYYGARGITVCPLFDTFVGFFATLGECPPGLTLERINTNGNYEPGNVKWATRKEQMRNMRHNRMITFEGSTKPLSQWAEEMRVSERCIRRRISAGWSITRALTTTPNAAGGQHAA